MTYITDHAAGLMLDHWTDYRLKLGRLRCDHAALIEQLDRDAKALREALEQEKARRRNNALATREYRRIEPKRSEEAIAEERRAIG